MRRAAACAALLAAGVVLLAACASAPPPASERANPCQDRVRLDHRREAAAFAVDARNDCFVPVEVTLDVGELENLRPSRALPVVRPLAPGETARLLRLEVVDAGRPARYRAHPRLRIGGEVRPDPAARYAFPFGGEARRLSQGVDGGETHSGPHRFAFDFEMPLGTPVLAARPGVVFQVLDGYGPGSRTERALERGNAVTVRHDDGTLALYGHLHKGVCAREGQRVGTGELLGWSGSSGYSSGPHLHFEVGALVGDERQELASLPILFEGDRVPEVGGSYPAQPFRGRAGACD
jgi:murein DD-endopeptidase MepM/ murein hydrolase activator NlpD